MSDIAIRAVDLRKVYRLYKKPSYRFRDMFGLLGDRPGAYTEHAALDGVTLDIRRGEKVAIIGRNGAGKSTFLKLVTNVVQPTSGALEVQGTVHALLQIGTGFHPDFTGRENIYAYFAQLGVTGHEADRRCAEVIDFAELEEYIEQPVKTYSTGMGVRLMFAASTAISPDLLVLDEVLGVGDAYFAHKSHERIKNLCAAQHTTLLLVTHDVYTAARVCDRMIWIDHGQVLVDSSPDLVVTAYEDSIRRQEERRLRVKRLASRHGNADAADSLPLIVELRSRNGRSLPCPVYISRIALAVEGTVMDSLPIGQPRTVTADLVLEGSSWGEAVDWHGRRARVWQNFGSVFHKVAGEFNVAGLMTQSESQTFSVIVEYWSEVAVDVTLRAFLGDREFHLGDFVTANGTWETLSGIPTAEGPAASDGHAAGLALGSGRVAMTDIRCVDDAGSVKSVFVHGEPFTLSVRYRVNDPTLDDAVQVLASFHRDGVEDICRVYCRGIRLNARPDGGGTLLMRLPKMGLGVGKYTISLGITEAGYFERQQALFYSINPGMYDCFTRGLEIEVVGGGIVGSGTGVVADAEWRIAGVGETA